MTVVITDGQSVDSAKTLVAANSVQLNDIGLIAVGVGSNVNDLELQNIASDPDSDYVFRVTNYKNLQSMSTAILKAACTCKIPLTSNLSFMLSSGPVAYNHIHYH